MSHQCQYVFSVGPLTGETCNRPTEETFCEAHFTKLINTGRLYYISAPEDEQILLPYIRNIIDPQSKSVVKVLQYLDYAVAISTPCNMRTGIFLAI